MVGVTQRALLAELKRLEEELGQRPTVNAMDEHGRHSHTTYVRYFDEPSSWTNALEAAFDDE